MRTIISLGAGVQSSTMALMAALGEITPMPDCAIFADTGAEPRKVYEWLDWLEKQLPFPVHRVMKAQGLKKNILDSLGKGRLASPPFFTESDEKVEVVSGLFDDMPFLHKRSGGGQLRRQCTSEFKIGPLIQETRRQLGLRKGGAAPKKILVETWIGISTDEASRMKPAREHYIVHRWPLIERNMSRQACLAWMQSKGFPEPSKSACTFCPYHDDQLWQDMKDNDPESWAEAVDIDRRIRGGVRGTKQKLYLHSSLKPLDEVVFKKKKSNRPSLFENECEGMCGV